MWCATHTRDREAVTGWFLAHGFTGTEDGRLRKQVGGRARDTGQDQAGRPGTGRAEPPDDGRAGAVRRGAGAGGCATAGGERGPGDAPTWVPGHEESGGYVDPERHRY